MPKTSSPRIPPWVMIASAGALVLGLALVKYRREKSTEVVPKVSLPLLDGKQQELQAGAVTIVDFWATWCQPCKASMPRVQHVFRDYTPRGVQLFSIDTDDDSGDRDPMVREFLMQNRLDFPVALGDNAVQAAFKVSALPTMMVIGKDGRIAWKHVGQLDANKERELRRALDDALAVK